MDCMSLVTHVKRDKHAATVIIPADIVMHYDIRDGMPINWLVFEDGRIEISPAGRGRRRIR